MTEEKRLRAALREWIDLLNLGDWHITLDIVPERQIQDADGDNEVDLKRKRSAIRICQAKDLREGIDQEQVLIHELLHIPLASVVWAAEDDSPSRHTEMAEEQLTESLSHLLWRLKREMT